MTRTRRSTRTAADTLCAIQVFQRVNLHRANGAAFSASNAICSLDRSTVNTDRIGTAVNCAKRADVAAKGSEYPYGCQRNEHKKPELPPVQYTFWEVKLAGIENRQGNRALQRADRTEPLAKSRRVGQRKRQSNYKNEQNKVLAFSAPLVSCKRFPVSFGYWKLIKQLLYQPKWA